MSSEDDTEAGEAGALVDGKTSAVNGPDFKWLLWAYLRHKKKALPSFALAFFNDVDLPYSLILIDVLLSMLALANIYRVH